MHFKKDLYSILLALTGIVAADFIILFAFVYTQDSPMDALTTAFIIIPVIAFINLVIALTLYLVKHKRGAWMLLANCIFAPIIFTQLARLHYHYYRKTHFTTYYFTYNQHKFEIELEKDNNFYSLSDVTNQPHGSTIGFVGDYKFKNDSIILIDSFRRPVIIGYKLIDYPKTKDTIQLIKLE